jgi:hypothetical protein
LPPHSAVAGERHQLNLTSPASKKADLTGGRDVLVVPYKCPGLFDYNVALGGEFIMQAKPYRNLVPPTAFEPSPE